VHVPVTISMADSEGASRRGESTPASPSSVRTDSPNGEQALAASVWAAASPAPGTMVPRP
jgi:hypothetical protein